MASALGILPGYTPSSPAPSYSRNPHSDESSLEYTPLLRQPILIPDGIFTKKFKHATLILHNQNPDVAAPVYGPHLSLVSGDLIISSPERVISVQLQLHGTLDARLPQAKKVITTLDRTQMLYKQGETIGACPERIPFESVIPSTYTHPTSPDREINMPPTFETPKSEILRAHVKCRYSLTITIKKTQKVLSLAKPSSMCIPFIYEIRARPRHPPINLSSPLEIIKEAPEEWTIMTCAIGVKAPSIHPSLTPSSLKETLTPIECQLVLPARRVFALSDRIPFHLELYSDHTPESITEFFGPGITPLGESEENIKLSFVRQVNVRLDSDTGEVEGTRHFVLGNAVMRRVPPKLEDEENEQRTINWEGEISLDADRQHNGLSNCGGFESGVVRVDDFLVLCLTPWCHRTSSFETCRRMLPVMFVTDPWAEVEFFLYLDSMPTSGFWL